MEDKKIEKLIIEKAAKDYSNKEIYKIREMKYLHGSTQIYYAFLAGVKFAKELKFK